MKEFEGAPRYSLIVEANNNDKYYFDTSIGTFVKMEENDKPRKSSLQALDYLTSSFTSLEEISQNYEIDDIKKAYITYQFKGEKRLRPIFNNKTWAHIASTYNGHGINFKDEIAKKAYDFLYGEIVDLDSDFSTKLLRNEKKLINLSPATKNSIECLRAHENAIRMKKKYGFGETKDSIYDEDRYGFYIDLQKKCQSYREFRTLYMNCCRYKNLKLQEQIAKNEEPPVKKEKRKVVVPSHQMTIDELLNEIEELEKDPISILISMLFGDDNNDNNHSKVKK